MHDDFHHAIVQRAHLPANEFQPFRQPDDRLFLICAVRMVKIVRYFFTADKSGQKLRRRQSASAAPSSSRRIPGQW
jgi:hypothetical protein